MGRYSERQAVIKQLQQLISLAAVTSSWPRLESMDHAPPDCTLHFTPPLALLLHIYEAVLAHRYLYDRTRLPKREPPFNYLFSLRPKEFKQEARTSQESFWQIVERIQTHAVFSSKSNYKQAPVEEQFFVFLAK
ncbi:hypothetical protein ACHHYP_07002 [Achlya hypogyna]|uniref:Uncharacterized protein n=1 Tax=Achlya hypogyna TaxID=1202772 RepID=A0A1V9YRG8_ACHHY|nr:hypothetical protein ACHHYP_07002 [Achlya hypogyna]